MSKDIIDAECESNEAVFIAGTCGSGKTDFIREYAIRNIFDIFSKGTVVETEFFRRAHNRIFVQTKLYEIYFKPDGVSLEDSGLYQLNDNHTIIHYWSLNDHNEATKLLKICQGNMESFKANLPTMTLHMPSYTICKTQLEMVRKHYKQIIDYYEATGFLEELSTCI